MIDIQDKLLLINRQYSKNEIKKQISLINYFPVETIYIFINRYPNTYINDFVYRYRPFSIFLEIKYSVDNLFVSHGIYKCKKTLDKYFIRYLNDTANPLNTSHYTHKTIDYD